jgi:hypothetical protein
MISVTSHSTATIAVRAPASAYTNAIPVLRLVDRCLTVYCHCYCSVLQRAMPRKAPVYDKTAAKQDTSIPMSTKQ